MRAGAQAAGRAHPRGGSDGVRPLARRAGGDGFLAAHPEASIDLVMNDRYVDLVEEGVDLSIRIANLDPTPSFMPAGWARATRLSAPPGLPAAQGTPRAPADLTAMRFVVYTYFDDPETLTLGGADGQ